MIATRKAVGGFVISSIVMAVAASSHAQPRPAQLAPQQLQARPLNLKPIAVSPDLKAVLAKKPKFDPSKVQLTYSGPIPNLKVRAKTFMLEPIVAEPTPPANLQMKTLPSSVAPFKAHIDSPYVVSKRLPKFLLADVVSSNMQWQTPVKDQGSRGTCTAFASVAGLEARGRREGQTRDLSENHAFSLFMAESNSSCTVSGGYVTWKTGPVLMDRPICGESLMPYTSSACPNGVPVACQSGANSKLTGATYFFTPEYGGAGTLRADNTNLLEAFIKAGHDIVYGLNVAGSDWSDGTAESGIIDVQTNGNGDPAGSYGGHAMLIVGYNHTDSYFIVKNSWGTDWGHNGYAWISYDYIQTYGKYGYAITNATVP